MALDTSKPLNEKNRRSLRLDITKDDGGRVGVANEGFTGMSAEEGGAVSTFPLRPMRRTDSPGPIVGEPGRQGAWLPRKIDGIGPEWKKFECSLTAAEASSSAGLMIHAFSTGTLWLDMVSLFPKQTWKDRPNGLRPDLAEMLAAMKPAFVRFPGGCYVEGNRLANAFRWKDSIGDVAQRPGHWNLWGYRSTDGLGYHEYLQMCEDLKAEPLYVINCGMAHEDRVPMDQMGPWVQDALDAIEYANGPATSKWGALRAKAGHPAPVQPQVPGDRQRERRAALPGALSPLLRRAQGPLPGDHPGGRRARPASGPPKSSTSTTTTTRSSSSTTPSGTTSMTARGPRSTSASMPSLRTAAEGISAGPWAKRPS